MFDHSLRKTDWRTVRLSSGRVRSRQVLVRSGKVNRSDQAFLIFATKTLRILWVTDELEIGSAPRGQLPGMVPVILH